ncbi:MAG: hypothetical protein HC830_03605 [Bacteroidetes bacterium]|nr:hypothetical protein [Bacteroidota bacterium]
MQSFRTTSLKTELLFNSHFITVFFFTSFLVKLLVDWLMLYPPTIETSTASLATIENVNIKHRVHIYYFALIAYIIVFYGLHNLFRFLNTRQLCSGTQKYLNSLSIIGVILLMASLLGNGTADSLGLIVLVLLLILLYNIISFRKKSDHVFIILNLLIIAFSGTFLIYGLWPILMGSMPFGYYYLIFSVIFIAGWGLLYSLKENTYKPNIIFLLISLIPLCSFLSSEIYLIFNQREIQFLSSGKIYRILIMLLVSIAVIFFFKKFKVHVRYTVNFFMAYHWYHLFCVLQAVYRTTY